MIYKFSPIFMYDIDGMEIDAENLDNALCYYFRWLDDFGIKQISDYEIEFSDDRNVAIIDTDFQADGHRCPLRIGITKYDTVIVLEPTEKRIQQTF